jgi:hypothetical protein
MGLPDPHCDDHRHGEEEPRPSPSPRTGATTGHGKNGEGAVDGLRQRCRLIRDRSQSAHLAHNHVASTVDSASGRSALATALVLEDLGSVRVPARRLATENHLNRIRDEEINKRVDLDT